MINQLNQEDTGFEYHANYRRDEQNKNLQSRRRAEYGRKKAPSVHNGIHRRRNKRFAW
jgi:hypothetical protein